MIPMRGMNPRRLQQMMKQMGINIEELSGVEEVIIKTADSEIVFSDAQVTIMGAQGMRTYQITGTPETHPRELKVPEEDVTLVAGQTGVSADEARAALKDAKGDLAEAIMKLRK
ncbi:MAG: nascent polypeptide-associated complex protein [Methanosarcinales archaeon]|nr:MAG: nascent polypeptide-associated complex protein [Methanosarcinales archaeon]